MDATAEDIRRALVASLREHRNAKRWALEHDFSPSFVSRVLAGKVPPSERMRAALGFGDLAADHVRQARTRARSRAKRGGVRA